MVCLNPSAGVIGTPHELPSYGIRRIQAAVIADPDLADAEVLLIDSREHGIDANEQGIERYVRLIEDFDPDIVGFSVYLWSFPTLIEVAARIKARCPERMIVFGGPSARPAMFSLEPFKGSLDFVDAIVIREGEETFREIVSMKDRSRDRLSGVRGIAVATPEGWRETAERPLNENLDSIASPYQLGLMPKGMVGFLETYRGCPLSCRFCEWGVSGGAGRVFSKEYIARELRALRAAECKGAFDLDAGLNLNSRAFKNLREAEAEVGFFKQEALVCDVYPSLMNEDYYTFLRESRTAYIGVGLQSFSKSVLDLMDRPFNQSKFEHVVRELSKVGPVEIQLIMGLPGDNLRNFLETFERARQLPVHLRVYHCLVLPDALMTRSLPSFDIKFDPYSLKMISCLGWTEEDFAQAREYLISRAATELGADAPRREDAPGQDNRIFPNEFLDPLDRPTGAFYPSAEGRPSA